MKIIFLHLIFSTILFAESVQETTVKFLEQGKQSEAESYVEGVVKDNPSVDSIFIFGVLTRSRFNVERSLKVFGIIENKLKGERRDAVKLVMSIDSDKEKIENFTELNRVANASNDPFIWWLAAISARTVSKPDEGVLQYEKICKIWVPGPVLVHQTYANLLHELKRYDEAVIHRKIAIDQERAPWALHAMGVTLSAAGKENEAELYFKEAYDSEPDSKKYFYAYIESLFSQKKYQDAKVFLNPILEVEPDNAYANFKMGYAEFYTKNFKESELRWKKALDLEPGNESYKKTYEWSLKQKEKVKNKKADVP